MKNSSNNIIYDAQSVNFREIRMGNIAPNILYRSSHPIINNKQEKAISLLAAKTNILTVINLSDTMSAIARKAFYAPWYNKLLGSGRVLALCMDFNYTNPVFKRKLKEALQFMIHTEGPYLIHCHAGIDRTGFVCMVIESFMGASLNDVINDYLMSFNSIFESSILTTQKADEITAMQLLSVMSSSQKINEENLQLIAEIYLRKNIKMSAEEIELLRRRLSGMNNLIGK